MPEIGPNVFMRMHQRLSLAQDKLPDEKQSAADNCLHWARRFELLSDYPDALQFAVMAAELNPKGSCSQLEALEVCNRLSTRMRETLKLIGPEDNPTINQALFNLFENLSDEAVSPASRIGVFKQIIPIGRKIWSLDGQLPA